MNAHLHQPIGGAFAPGVRNQDGKYVLRLAEDVQGLGRAGELITLAATPADVTNQTEELDSYLGGYRPMGFAADMVSKVVLVDKEAGTRRDFSLENAFEVVDPRNGRHGAIKEVDHKSETASYRVSERALASYIPFSTENDAVQLYNVRAASGEMISWKLALWREIEIWTDLTTVANWNAANRTTLLAAAQWNGGASADPMLELHTRIKASAQVVTDIFMNPDVGFYFLADSKVRDYMKQMLGDNAPSPEVAAGALGQGIRSFTIPGLPPIHIVPAKKLNSSGSLEFILDDSVVLVTNQPGVPRDGNSIATHYTFRYRGRSGTGMVTNEYIPQGRGINGGTMFELGHSDDPIFTSNIAGGLIKDVLT